MFNYKVFVAELIGTFALVFVGSAAGIYDKALGLGLLGVALAHGLTLAAFVYVYGHISGTHINPAVTLGLMLNGTVKWFEAIVYWVAQLAGAVLAAVLLRAILTPLSPGLFAQAATSGALTADTTKVSVYYAMALEALLTFFLVNAVLHSAVDGKAGPFAGWAIGTTLTIAILVGGPLTGASLNPARSFGPAIFTSALHAGTPDYQNPMFYVIYFIGPFLGSVMAVLIYQLLKSEPATANVAEDMEEVEVVEEVAVAEKPAKAPARKPAARKSAKK